MLTGIIRKGADIRVVDTGAIGKVKKVNQKEGMAKVEFTDPITGKKTFEEIAIEAIEVINIFRSLWPYLQLLFFAIFKR